MPGIVAILLLLAGLTGGAADLFESFEDQVPGDPPRGWHHAWGDQGDDLLAVSNLQAAAGRHSLLLDRATHVAQWGAQCSLPLPDDDAASCWLTFRFRVEGKGDRAHFGIELRNGTRRALSLRFGGGRLAVVTHLPDAPAELRGGTVGRCRANEWHTVAIRMPTWRMVEDHPDDAFTATVSLDGGDPVRVATDFAKQPRPLLMLCTAPDRTGYRLYLDDLVWSHSP